MNSGFFKSSEPLDRCVGRLDRFEAITFGQLISDAPKPVRYRIKATYLYASKSQKKYRTFQPARGSLTQVNKEISTFDRFVVYGVPGTPHVLISFFKTPASTKHALRFSNYMSPGTDVYLIMPRIASYLGPQNPEIITNDPVIPVATSQVSTINVMPPADVEAPNYTCFDFVTKSLNVFAATPQDNVCTGSFCDAQTNNASCPCTSSDPHKHWALGITFTCAEFDDIARSHIVLTSLKTSSVFISADKLQWPLTNDAIDAFDLDDSVSFYKWSSDFMK